MVGVQGVVGSRGWVGRGGRGPRVVGEGVIGVQGWVCRGWCGPRVVG